MTGGGPYIAVTPAGSIDTALLSAVAEGVGRMFGLPVKILPLISDLAFALDGERHQYHSTAILSRLTERCAGEVFKVVGITDVDLFIPILTFVHGEAQLGGKACIVSTYRLKEVAPEVRGHDAYLRRVVKEAIHELCHTFDLRHCRDASCIMHFCRNAEEVDRRPESLCRYCAVLLDDAMRRADLAKPLVQASDSAG